MDFLTLQTRLIERLGEPSTPVYWELSEIKLALNKANRFFCLLTLCVERSASFNLTAAQAFYTVSSQLSDFLVPLRVTTSAGARLQPYTLHELNLESDTWRATAGTPTRYMQQGYDLFAISPQPAGAGTSLLIRYAASPAVMTGNTDEPEIPEEQRPCLIDYALYWLRLKEGGQELAKTLPHLGAFLDVAQKHAAFVRAKSKGQLYDNQPFDLQSFDRSRLMKLVLAKGASQNGTGKR